MQDYIRVIIIICGILLIIVFRSYWMKLEREYSSSTHKGIIKIPPFIEILIIPLWVELEYSLSSFIQ